MNLKDYIKKNYMFVTTNTTPITNNFTLSSGTESNLYFDIKGLMLDPIGASMVHFELVKLITDKIQGLPYVVVGMELGGAQIVQFMVARGWHGAIIRKNKKEHGLRKRMEGYLISKHNNVVIVDDVITTGNTVEEVKDFIKSNILGTFCVIDRTPEQKYNSLFKEKDFNVRL